MPLVTMQETYGFKPELDKVIVPELRFTLDNLAGSGPKTYVIEDHPRIRVINFRHHFYAGDKYTQYSILKPWSYYLARIKDGYVLLSTLFFAEKRLETLDEEGLRGAPLPNNDYGTDKGLGVCLWKAGYRFGPTDEEAARNAHDYIWTSDWNPGVRYYTTGRPPELCPKRGTWRSALRLWSLRTRAQKPIKWVTVRDYKGVEVLTLRDAFHWLSATPDGIYQ